MQKQADKQQSPKTPEQQGQATTPQQPVMKPGDQAPPGTPGTGENICPVCSGEGTVEGQTCENCSGTGLVVEGIGGA